MVGDIDNPTGKPDQQPPKRIRKSWVGKEAILIFLAVCLVGILTLGLFLIYLDRSNDSVKMAFIEQRINTLEQRISAHEKQQATQNIEPVKNLEAKVDLLEKRLIEKEKTPEPPKLAPSPEKKRYHEVQKGETLFQIARKYKISVDDLRRANNLSADAALVQGQKLLIEGRNKR